MTMRKLPRNVAALFLAITLFRVANFSAVNMKAGYFLGFLFSAGLGIAVYLSSYNMRVWGVDRNGEETRQSKDARTTALVALLFFGVVDGLFNLWDVQASVKDASMQVAAFLYGIFPTIAAGLLGWLQGKVDKLPVPPKPVKHAVQLTAGSVVIAFMAKVLRIDVRTLQMDQTQQQQLQEQGSADAPSITVMPAAQSALPVQAAAPVLEAQAASSAAAVQVPVTIACLVQTCKDTFTGKDMRQAIARRSAHMRWHHPELHAAESAESKEAVQIIDR